MIVRKLSRASTIALLLTITAGCWSLNANPNASQPSGAGSLASPTAGAAISPSVPELPSDSQPTAPSASPLSPSSSSSASPEANDIEHTLDAMTLKQKIGQLLLVGVEGTTISEETKQLLKQTHAGGVILFKGNLASLASSARLINGLKAANAGSPAPLIVSVDQEGGRVSRLPKAFVEMPSNAEVGAANNAGLTKQMGGLIAKELSLLGFNVDFAPVLDINSNPNNPVIGNRSFGDNAALVTKHGLAEMNGIQSGGIIPVVKHFPGHGDTSVDSHIDLPVVNKTAKQLAKFEWLPFKSAIESDADAVMVAHILYPRIDPDAPASFSKIIIHDQLRGKLGFQGVVFTDDLTMGAIAKNYGIGEAAVRAIQAGGDIVLVGHGYDNGKLVFDKLVQSVRDGKLTESRVDESVERILKLKRRYGLTDKAIPIPKASDIPNDRIEKWKEAVLSR
ncbi:beta-N-acetylhexosaminidase [Cohnella faecalis]|uniref:beta-N-acetylhexosaminidase n=1 Tax=Cohnella faecalis TaxID=2315694 RepID=A0A398CP69_9BACL|nr:beta-N-acetylhexosaminidase [Cohnella faecalis]RIE04315.1 beta-N-acetylhexosaminidase [Cohnella faecalis]